MLGLQARRGERGRTGRRTQSPERAGERTGPRKGVGEIDFGKGTTLVPSFEVMRRKTGIGNEPVSRREERRDGSGEFALGVGSPVSRAEHAGAGAV